MLRSGTEHLQDFATDKAAEPDRPPLIGRRGRPRAAAIPAGACRLLRPKRHAPSAHSRSKRREQRQVRANQGRKTRIANPIGELLRRNRRLLACNRIHSTGRIPPEIPIQGGCPFCVDDAIQILDSIDDLSELPRLQPFVYRHAPSTPSNTMFPVRLSCPELDVRRKSGGVISRIGISRRT